MYRKTIIDSNKSVLNFRELIDYKDLFISLSVRDFKIRYAQTTIGFLWAFIQPIITLTVTVSFGRFVGVETDVPLLFTVAGTSLWSYFSFVLTNSGSSIIENQNMIKKIYFPRLIIPLSKELSWFY